MKTLFLQWFNFAKLISIFTLILFFANYFKFGCKFLSLKRGNQSLKKPASPPDNPWHNVN